MCGIAGILSFDAPVSGPEIRSMTDSIAHRGPDGEGCWISDDGMVGFGHRRLAIIDLSENGAQPMLSNDGRFTITFNGEIYNYIELRQHLQTKGISFHTDSDTEVLLNLYAYYGASCVDHLDGMFAFAIRDNKFRTLFLARDRFGEKPLFYFSDESRFVFASEMKAIFAAGVKREVDPKRLHYYLSFNLYQDPNDFGSTFFQRIRQVEAGQTVTITDSGRISTNKYWQVDPEVTTGISFTEAKEQFDYLLKQSITRRLRSDVPVGSSLSGGLDSSTIVLLIDQLRSGRNVQKTFSARFKDFSKDEGKYIDRVLEVCKSVQGYAVWPGMEAMADLDTIWYHQEEPFGSASIVAQWSVMKLAKEHNVTVLLDGQGADEILGGYRSFFQPLLNTLYAKWSPDFEIEASKLKSELGFEYSVARNTRLMLRYPQLFRTVSGIKAKLVPSSKPKAERKNYTSDFYAQISDLASPFLGENNDNVRLLQKRIIERQGFSPLLRYADRNSMAHARELRLPFLDHKLVEFCISLPDQYKVSNGWTKRLLRETYRDLLPPEICWRKDKIGFVAPQEEWMKAPGIADRVLDAESVLKSAGILETGKHFDSWHTLMAAKLIKP